MNRAVILFTLACTAASAFASENQHAYKWTDANGVVHFSDAPPPSDAKNVQPLHLIGGTAATPDSAAPDSAVSDAGKPAAPGVTAEAAEARAKKCEQAHSDLKLLQSALPVNEIDANGKIKPVEDTEREARITGILDRIAQLCTN